ncbi:hypothetical protein ISN44_As12g037640 [Arabidopsis suecica]|uniref:Uncharacterized protein n=1 Tax=Arabidopsis suecica TaxID=45249 RepID=A0A8T1YQQ1_ARASU|nr:hypothetical protein ISN44_As12g037640 [Arabidopsis suecica]
MNSQNDNKDESSTYYDTAKIVVGVAGAIIAIAGLAFLRFTWRSEETKHEKKMMKAPGGNGYIRRKPFEENPKEFFEQQRINRRNSRN